MSTHHFNWVKFTMELRQEDAEMTCIIDGLLEHRDLMNKVLLLAKKSCHATVTTLEWTDRCAFRLETRNIKSTDYPRSVRTVFSPFGCPESVVIFCMSPRLDASGLDWGITVSRCRRCFPPSDLFISKALSASGGSEA